MVAHQRLAAEGAPHDESSSLALIDRVKAYELVPHHSILGGAVRLLKYCVSGFVVSLLPRRILAPLATIIAGSFFGACF